MKIDTKSIKIYSNQLNSIIKSNKIQEKSMKINQNSQNIIEKTTKIKQIHKNIHANYQKITQKQKKISEQHVKKINDSMAKPKGIYRKTIRINRKLKKIARKSRIKEQSMEIYRKPVYTQGK